MDVVASFPSDAEASEAVEPDNRALDSPAMAFKAGAGRYSTAGDDRFDALRPDQPAVLVVVIAAVAEQDVGPSTGSSHESRDRRDLGEQGQQLGNDIAVSAGQGHRERDALPVDEDVVLAARPCAIDRAGTVFGPRRAARTGEESITARDQSSCFAARNRASSTTCSLSQTPASFQAASRRQHVMPEPKHSSCGRYSHWIPVCNTNRIARVQSARLNARPRGPAQLLRRALACRERAGRSRLQPHSGSNSRPNARITVAPRPQDSSAWPRWCHRRIFTNWWEGKTGEKVHGLGEQISLLQPHLQRPGPPSGYVAFDLCRQTACSSPPLSCPRSAAASSYTARNWAYGRSGTPASTAKARRCTSTATCERPTRLPM